MTTQKPSTALLFSLTMGLYCVGMRFAPVSTLLGLFLGGVSAALTWSVAFRREQPGPLRAAFAGAAAMCLSSLLLLAAMHVGGDIFFAKKALAFYAASPGTYVLFIAGACAGLVARGWASSQFSRGTLFLPPTLASALVLGLAASFVIALRCLFTSLSPGSVAPSGARLAVDAGISTAVLAAFFWFLLSPLMRRSARLGVVLGALSGAMAAVAGLPFSHLYWVAWHRLFSGYQHSLDNVLSNSLRFFRVMGLLALVLGALYGALLGAMTKNARPQA